MNIRILSIALLFGFGAQTGLGYEKATFDFVKKNKRLPLDSDRVFFYNCHNKAKARDKRDFDSCVKKEMRNLENANLSNATLSGANLSGANLSGANLTGTDLSGANLTGANLSRTALIYSNLTGTDLTGADLSKAFLGYNHSELITKEWLKKKGAKNVDSVKGIN